MADDVVTDDYYALLEVSQFASPAVIRESYKRLALKFHPDKNKGETATSDFQRLVVAWETLKDATKRAEYDRIYIAISKRKHESDSEEDLPEVKKRKSEFDRHAKGYYASEKEAASTASTTSSGSWVPQHDAEEEERRQRVVAWKTMAGEDYRTRLQAWSTFRKSQVAKAREAQGLISKYQIDLEGQLREDEAAVTRRFNQAIEQSRSSGHDTSDSATVLTKLLAARKVFITKLVRAIGEHQRKLQHIVRALDADRKRYEEEDCKVRQERVQEALELLGPPELNRSYLNPVDHRGNAIHYWKGLARVKVSPKLTSSLEACSDNPWHEDGVWQRQVGEYPCARCYEPAFHIIPECGPAKCPGCGMIACNTCHRDLQLLREYGKWIQSPAGEPDDSRFSLNSGPGYMYTTQWERKTERTGVAASFGLHPDDTRSEDSGNECQYSTRWENYRKHVQDISNFGLSREDTQSTTGDSGSESEWQETLKIPSN